MQQLVTSWRVSLTEEAKILFMIDYELRYCSSYIISEYCNDHVEFVKPISNN